MSRASLGSAFWAVAMVAALGLYRLSLLVEPLYRARPELLLGRPSLILPPGATACWAETALGFLLVWVVECLAYCRLRCMEWREAVEKSLWSYGPLLLLFVFGLALVPGLPTKPAFAWWLALEARKWVLTIALAGVVYRKARVLGLGPSLGGVRCAPLFSRRWATCAFVVGLVAVLVVLTPERRFTQPYDQRWGTGDEPRYVRIAASLLHDGDADVSNAGALIGRKAQASRWAMSLLGWIPSATETAGEVLSNWAGSPPGGQARPLGGQVIRGRDGGVYYVYLPGFPLLLTPAMALDSYFHPDRLALTLLTCLILSAVTVLAMARLTEPFVGSRIASYAVSLGLGLSIPMFFYHFQLYPEVTAALCVTLMLGAVLEHETSRGRTLAFAIAGSLLPWLHTKYYPLWAVCILAFVWKLWRDKARWSAYASVLALPVASVGLQCLFVFHITGSLLPDSLWVLNGYRRSASWWNPETPAGLYYTLVDRAEGLFVYSPVYLLALPGILALRRQSHRAFWLSLAVVVPYLWIAASHDVGGAGGWSPPARYIVPTVPVWALWLASWLGGRRAKPFFWAVWFAAVAASFWIAWAMRAERHFPYDRGAFLASLTVSPLPVLGTVLEPQPAAQRWLYPMLLALALALVALVSRWKRPGDVRAAAVALFTWLLLAGAASVLRTEPDHWIRPRGGRGPVRLRPGVSTVLWTPACRDGTTRLRFESTDGPHRLRVGSVGFRRELHVPSNGVSELALPVKLLTRLSRAGREELGWVELRLDQGQKPLDVRCSCR